MSMTYSEQLRHPEWQKMRLTVLNAAGWKCEQCGEDQSTLHVHHKRYIKGRKAWEYEPENFEALCEHCHKDNHAAKERINLVLASIPGYMWDEAANQLVFWAWDYLPDGTERPVDPYGDMIAELAAVCRERLDIYQLADLVEHAKNLPTSTRRVQSIED